MSKGNSCDFIDNVELNANYAQKCNNFFSATDDAPWQHTLLITIIKNNL